MLSNFSHYLYLLKQSLFLNRSAFLELSQAGFYPAITVVFLAGLSQAIGQSLILFVNKVSKRRFLFSLILNAIIFTFSFLFLVLSISFMVDFVYHHDKSFRTVSKVTAIAYLPYLFSFLTLAPYFGSFIAMILSLWNLAAIIAAISVVFSLNIFQALAVSILGWLLKQVLKTSIGRPIQDLSKIIKKAVAGKPLEFSKQKIREIIGRGRK